MMRPSRSLTFALSLATITLAGCAERNPIDPGTYTARAVPYAGAKLEIAADKRSVTFTLPAGAVVKRSAKAWEQARWPTLCPRGLKDTSSEVLDLGPEPLDLGPKRVDKPALVANCLHKPIVELMTLDAEGKGVVKPEIVGFER